MGRGTREQRSEERKQEYQRHKEKIKARVKKWREDNPERAREWAREYAKTPKRYTQSQAYKREWEGRNKERVLFMLARKRARSSGLDFNIDVEDVVIPSHCPMLGIPLVRNYRGGPRTNSPSLDRIDQSQGYVKGNVWVISWQANRMKFTASLDDLIIFARNTLKHFDK